MIKFMEACQIAKEKLIDNGYLGDFIDIRENSNKWFFESRFSMDRGPEYGNVPVSVDKENGKCETFMMFAPGNIGIFLDTTPVKIPVEYKL